ncbi:chromosome partitioning protein ParA [Vibrio sp. JC009]|uniref:chromosome partitioning protein ParA n=1 Tax=Vibrio sp. JC009 TaxID=2912314 RepID=UPI0023B098DB|nr:chromosome partitioning protein ParA [Vibrio sp. JC009]WED23214.1 chromosome partitioning protein ParA [Vibrio sp. JC009]
MSKENKSLNSDDDDVVVIEERDKHTLLYIGLSAILGLAIGGLAGSVLTKAKWETAYGHLEAHILQMEKDKTQVIVKVEEKEAEIDKEVEERLQQEILDLKATHEEELAKSRSMVEILEKVNLDLDSQVSELKALLKEKEGDEARLAKQNDMQTLVIERSRELFQKEYKVKQELQKLREEREKLAPKLERFKKECDIYLDGKSWDASADACDKQDETNSRLSQIDQMIEVHKMDLREIQQIADSVGL